MSLAFLSFFAFYTPVVQYTRIAQQLFDEIIIGLIYGVIKFISEHDRHGGIITTCNLQPVRLLCGTAIYDTYTINSTDIYE